MSYGKEGIAGKDEGRKPDLGTRDGCGVPRTLLSEGYQGVWKIEDAHGLSYKKKVVRLWNPNTGVVVYLGHDLTYAQRLADRINGWWDAATFPPPATVLGPAFTPTALPKD